MRKTLATIASVALILGNASAVFAADNATQVINSGTDAIVNSSANETNTVVVNNNNEAKVVQTSSSVNISGENNASGNISLPSGCGTCLTEGAGTSIVTGAATSETNMTASVNTNTTGVALPDNGGSSTNNLNVVNTGKNLGVNASSNTSNTVVVNNNNSAVLNQSANSVNISGQNVANDNIGTTSVLTGAAGSASAMSADANHNTTVVSLGSGVGFNGYVGCCGVPCYANNCTDITNTGKNALVNSSSNTTTAVVVNNNNRMWASQNVFATDISGQNAANNNIGGSFVVTGPAGSMSDMMLSGNENTTGVALGAGMPLGGNMLSVVNTGMGMVTNASANTNNVDVVNNANALWGWQANWAYSLSGQNTAFNNIGGAGVGTNGAGSASAFGLAANANNTFVGSMLSWPLWLMSFWV